jgi:type I restriction enzyme S subunit
LITATKVKNEHVPLPPLSEQQIIASYLDEKCSEIDSLISIKQSKIESLKEYKKSIIYEYVTGKKEVI